jgi:hypothetical protein
MPKKNKLKKNKPVESSALKDELPETKDAKKRRRKTNTIAIASAILAVIIGVSVFGWFLIYKQPLMAKIITVNNKSVSVEYVLERCLFNMQNSSTPDSVTPLSVVQTITHEMVIEQIAAQPPYNIHVTEADIDQELRIQANAVGVTTTPSGNTSTTTTTTPALNEAEYKEWYLQQLNLSQLPEKDFRNLVRVSIMATRLNTYLEDRMATTAEQVHLYDIVVNDSTTATDVANRINNGEDFQTIAKELSTDADTYKKGGDMGWIPLKVLDSSLENVASNLEIGKVSGPVQLSTAMQSTSSSGTNDQPYYLLMVTAKAQSMEIDPQHIATLQQRLMQDWLDKIEMSPSMKIAYHGRGQNGGYDSQTEAWLKYEMQKLKASRGITETTTTPVTTNPLSGQ